jgi:hypothetical protein
MVKVRAIACAWWSASAVGNRVGDTVGVHTTHTAWFAYRWVFGASSVTAIHLGRFAHVGVPSVG